MNQSTRLVARASDPRSDTGSRTYNALYRALDLQATYLQFGGQQAAELLEALRTLGFCGLTVVGHYAKEMVPLLDDLDGHARRVGAVNSIQIRDGRAKGYKTDGPAIIDAIEHRVDVRSSRVAVLGSGKIARELANLLPQRSVKEAVFFARDKAAGRQLADEFGVGFGGPPSELAGATFDAFVNATPIGSSGYEVEHVPEANAIVGSSRLIVDLTFLPFVTPLVEAARGAGVETVTGLEVFARQGARQVELYLDAKPELSQLEDLLRQEFT